ncbi:MAG: restriction endonuclease subunit S [Colwellia sp.]
MNEMDSIYPCSEVGDIAAVTKLAGFEFTNYFEYLDEGRIIALRALNIKKGGFNLDNVKYIAEDISKKLPRSKLFKGELLITYVGTIGQVAIVDRNDRYHLAPNVAKLTFNKFAYPDYVFQYLRSDFVISEYDRLVTTTSQPALSMGNIRKIKIPLPDLCQQQKIAKILSTVDNLIEKTQTLIEKYTAIKKGMMVDLFTRGIDVTTSDTPNSKGGKLRPSVEDAPELYKQTELGWVPKEWAVVNISDCVVRMKGGAAIKTHEFSSEGMGVIAKSDVTSSKYIDVGYRPQKISHMAAKGYQRSFVDKDFVVVTLRDLVPSGPTVGMAARFDGEGEFILAQGTYGFLFNEELIEPDLFVEYTRQDWFRSKIRGMTVGSTQVHARSSEYVNIAVPLPSITEQIELLNRISSIDANITSSEKQLEKLKLQKKGLMQDLLTGKVKL